MARGFAGMSDERRREVSAAGGRARAAAGVGHKFTSAEARAAAGLRRGAGGVVATPATPATPRPRRAPAHPLADIDWPAE